MDAHTPVGLGWAPKGPARGFSGTFKGHGEREASGDREDKQMWLSMEVLLSAGSLFTDASLMHKY